MRPAGADDLFPDYNLWTVAPLATSTAGDVDVPVITKGRAVDPSRADEMVVSEKLAADLAVQVGDNMTLESMTSEWVDVAFNGGEPGPPDGPRVDVAVVGLSRTPADFGRLRGVLHLSPAFVERYGDQLRLYAGVHVRLSEECAAPSARTARCPGLEEDIEVGPSPFGDDAATDDGLGTIATALRIVGLVAALAGAVVIALALARLTRLALCDRRILATLGWTRREFVEAAALVFAPWLTAGVGLGLLVGVLATSQAMVGLARRIDPTPGSVVVDVPVVIATARRCRGGRDACGDPRGAAWRFSGGAARTPAARSAPNPQSVAHGSRRTACARRRDRPRGTCQPGRARRDGGRCRRSGSGARW